MIHSLIYSLYLVSAKIPMSNEKQNVLYFICFVIAYFFTSWYFISIVQVVSRFLVREVLGSIPATT